MKFKKGQSGNPAGRPEGSKNATTLLKEERRAQFEQFASENWQRIMRELPATYVADQFIGKSPDLVLLNAEVNTSIVPEVLEIAEEELRKRKLKPND